MRTKIIISALGIACAIALILFACGGQGEDNKGGCTGSEIDSIKPIPPLNISIYLDLSDRLKRDLTPSQEDRDTAIVGYIADYFKDKTLGPQILKSKNKMKIFFYPTPQSSNIATLAEELSIDMEKLKGIEKRISLDSMRNKFNKNLDIIYEKTIKQDKWPGCDIWDFFSSEKVDTQCMREGYRNILVILTDGYLFDENHKVQNGDSCSFVTPGTLSNPNSALIAKRSGLQDLEVRILEVNPLDINHRDKLVSILEKWLKDMGVNEKNITVSETDLPTNTKTIIESFLN